MRVEEVELYWHDYKFFPYEKKFALREIESLLEPSLIEEKGNKITLNDAKNKNSFNKLVYFSHAKIDDVLVETLQHKFENTLKINNKIRSKRQNTRYSVHGLHEYKGKFNPQVVRSLFNIFGIKPGDNILDPFCGSGTSIVEAAHIGVNGVGTDINPLAAMIANTKVASLSISWMVLEEQKETFLKNTANLLKTFKVTGSDSRTVYLQSWFPADILLQMEALKEVTKSLLKPVDSIFLIIISNILRDYSLQEPTDLRIRRRKSTLPEKSFFQQIEESINEFIHSLKVFQNSFGLIKSNNTAFNLSIKKFDEKLTEKKESFDFAITSPPYATALPYIDTQRLSLVWLGLTDASGIKGLESSLIGSREFNIKAEQEKWHNNLIANSCKLPSQIHEFCINLMNMLEHSDGFRKKALPSLLYRYFYDMQVAFQAVLHQLKKDKFFALIVGHNHTMIGGKRTEIDTPEFLTYLGQNIGFTVHEVTKLEAYQRYGLNASNAVKSESLIVFKK
jgi:16S rRNA G966 N2-methylase RsmD